MLGSGSEGCVGGGTLTMATGMGGGGGGGAAAMRLLWQPAISSRLHKVREQPQPRWKLMRSPLPKPLLPDVWRAAAAA